MSEDSSSILDAVSEILHSNDKSLLAKIAPHVADIRKRVNQVNLGGAFIPNQNRFDLAMSYVLHSCDGACHCYVYPNLLLFYPDNEQKRGNITIHSVCDNLERYEEVFEVTCNNCGTAFTVTGNHGWHIPTYRWEKSDDAMS